MWISNTSHLSFSSHHFFLLWAWRFSFLMVVLREDRQGWSLVQSWRALSLSLFFFFLAECACLCTAASDILAAVKPTSTNVSEMKLHHYTDELFTSQKNKQNCRNGVWKSKYTPWFDRIAGITWSNYLLYGVISFLYSSLQRTKAMLCRAGGLTFISRIL